MGALMAALTAALLFWDQRLAPGYPCLLIFVLAAGLVSCLEMHRLLEDGTRPPLWICLAGVSLVLLAIWPAHLNWGWRESVFAAVLMAGFLYEMATFTAAGGSVQRIALLTWIVAYLGVLPSFLVQMRWRDNPPGAGLAAIALTIFVAKSGDIGAYFTGRLLAPC
jgi:phosphatidate cytidylyltransferase